MHYLALGDSYTIGEGVIESERWPSHLSKLLEDQGVRVDELTFIAQTGWTTGELLQAIAAADPGSDYQLVSLLIGVNNQYRGLSQEEYQREFVLLLKQAVHFASGEPGHVVVLSIPDWSVTPFAEEDHYPPKITIEIDAFNAINQTESERLGVHYVDVTPLSRRVGGDPSFLAADGLHPSGKMYARWAERVLPVALSILMENFPADHAAGALTRPSS
jgi:lysophospholipase L1-like esterase